MPDLKVGFTGSSQGMTLPQVARIMSLIQEEGELHHGDCVGADHEIHLLMRKSIRTILHPPKDDKKRAFCKEADEVRKPAPYIERNHNIVDETDMLVAAPAGPERSLPRSGTWATIRYALKIGKPTFIVMPDGNGVWK